MTLGNTGVDRARFTITPVIVGDTTRLCLSGELDVTTAGELREATTAALQRPGTTTVLLDCTDLAFLDSTGIAAMVSGRKRATADGITFTVVNPRGGTLRVLQLTALDRVLVGPDPAGPPR